MLDRKKIKSKLKAEVKRTYDQKDAGFSKSILDPTKMKEAGLKQWKFKIGEHLFDVLPFETGKNHPELPPGEITYVVKVWVHRNLGPNDDDFICESRTYGKPCYPCEVRSQLRNKDNRTEEEEATMAYALPKKRAVYPIWDRKNEDQGVLIFEVARFFFQDHLEGMMKNKKTGEVMTFCEVDTEGRSVGFEISGSQTAQTWGGFQFCERDEDIPDKILAQIPKVDELLYRPKYEEVKAAFNAGLVLVDEKTNEVECPFDGVFGDSFELLDECNTVCDKYKDCYDRYLELGGKAKEEEIPPETYEDEPPIPEPEPEPERKPVKPQADEGRRRRRR